MEYLKIAQELEMYGVNYFPIKVGFITACQFIPRFRRPEKGRGPNLLFAFNLSIIFGNTRRGYCKCHI